MDAGRKKEFAPAKALLSDPQSLLSKMVDSGPPELRVSLIAKLKETEKACGEGGVVQIAAAPATSGDLTQISVHIARAEARLQGSESQNQRLREQLSRAQTQLDRAAVETTGLREMLAVSEEAARIVAEEEKSRSTAAALAKEQ